jgi:DNA-binding MarR family transcriptional regulator
MNSTGVKGNRERRFDSPEQQAYLGLWRTYDRLRELEDELFAQWDITNQQYNVLRLLEAAHPALLPTQTVLKRLVSRAPDATRVLDKLAERGWIRKERSPDDRRAYWLGITGTGISALAEMAEPLRVCHERQLGHLSDEKLKELTILLHAVREPHEPDDSPWK